VNAIHHLNDGLSGFKNFRDFFVLSTMRYTQVQGWSYFRFDPKPTKSNAGFPEIQALEYGQSHKPGWLSTRRRYYTPESGLLGLESHLTLMILNNQFAYG
jgi:hypothetical protein